MAFLLRRPFEVIEINDNGDVRSTLIGPDIHNQQTFQYTVKSNTWFGSRVWGTGSFSLVGCTVYPGFDFRDFELGKRRALLKAFPQHEELIMNLTLI
ncbi:MAG: hypothetical protein K0R26_472 [Bacteroidota bacterium]|jgi:predicted cupin superfamily sugar epimerase|nr:hypothetical protein [Bacteroidota bacterium]